MTRHTPNRQIISKYGFPVGKIFFLLIQEKKKMIFPKIKNFGFVYFFLSQITSNNCFYFVAVFLLSRADNWIFFNSVFQIKKKMLGCVSSIILLVFVPTYSIIAKKILYIPLEIIQINWISRWLCIQMKEGGIMLGYYRYYQ